ncbi:MAG: carboxymuconolactone decarboxylase family protein [Rhodospirillales bacterium]|nr:carboxymuconolactone decarboxylase family protein [Rhodospirillales bacterium]
MSGDDMLERGKTIRAEVIGADRSAAALESATPFDRPFQELALRYCWGEIWGRPGLDRRMRSVVNLASLAAMGKPNELRIHVRGALTNGVTKAEIQEIFLQIFIYCCVLTAGEAFKVAREVFEEPEFADKP